MAAACTLGKNYQRPDVQTPSTFRSASGQPSAASLADLQWFELFRDDALIGLVKTALQENFELRIAAQRVLQARAAYGITRAGQWPSVDASADVIAARSSQVGANRGIPAGADTDVSYAQAGFSLSWELDVWGRLRRLSEAGRAQYLATEEARRGVITTLVADVGQTYLALRALDLELEIAIRTRDVANDNLRLVEARRASGVASGLDVHQAEQLLFTATGQIASIEREIALAENALSLLLGHAPEDIRAWATSRVVSGAVGSGRSAFGPSRTPARHPPGRAATCGGERANRRGQGRLLPAYQPDGLLWRAESRSCPTC